MKGIRPGVRNKINVLCKDMIHYLTKLNDSIDRADEFGKVLTCQEIDILNKSKEYIDMCKKSEALISKLKPKL